MIDSHDWLRRRAGSEYGTFKTRFQSTINFMYKQLLSSREFYPVTSPDLTMNSRLLISDLLSNAISNGLKILTSEKMLSVKENEKCVIVETENGHYESDNIVICSPDAMSKIFDIPVKTGFAPIAVVENINENENSFVELDYNPKKCINLLIKECGIGQAGGITVNNERDIKPYLNFVISQHKKRNPQINVIDSYIGLKKELVHRGEKRNYLYHINQHSSKIWSIVLGKFTLAFSMAPEFYRRVYKTNPTKNIIDSALLSDGAPFISKTSWQEIVDHKEKKNGND